MDFDARTDRIAIARGARQSNRKKASAARQIVAHHSHARRVAVGQPQVEVARVEEAFIEELERVAREPVTPDELARAHALIEADELGTLQRVEERADRLSMYATLFDDPGLIDRMLPRYLAVTPADIVSVAAQVFVPDNRLVLTYLPGGPAADSADMADQDAAEEEVAA